MRETLTVNNPNKMPLINELKYYHDIIFQEMQIFVTCMLFNVIPEKRSFEMVQVHWE